MAIVGLRIDNVAERQLRDLDALHRAAMRSAGRASAMMRGAAAGVLVDDGRLRGLQPLARRRLLPALVRAMALAHLLGRRRATIEAGRRDDVALSRYDAIELAWDESEHSREEKGSSEGGQFADKGFLPASASKNLREYVAAEVEVFRNDPAYMKDNSDQTQADLERSALEDFVNYADDNFGDVLEPHAYQPGSAGRKQVESELRKMKRMAKEARAILKGDEPPPRELILLDVYSDVKKVLRRTVGVKVKDLEAAYGRRAADALRQAIRKVDARVRGTLAEIGAAPTSRARALKLVSDALDSAGLGPEDSARLETVFRTSMLQAASIGRWQAFDEMGEDGPWGYRYVQIDRPTKRLEHVPLHGVTLPRDDPFWLTYWAPNGWNCECQCVPVWRSRPLRRPRILPELDPEFESSPEDWADELTLAFAWDESEHPREEAGTSEGGRFTDSVLSVWKGEPERVYKSEMGVADSALAEEFNSALDKLPKYEGVVWRGTELRDNSLEPGAAWRQPHSAAASTESKYATNYAGALPDGRLLVLKIASKTGALLKGDEDENEVILRRKTSYRLEKVTDEKLGSQYFAVAHLVEVFDVKLAWDESKHPREEAGSSEGGQFIGKFTYRFKLPGGDESIKELTGFDEEELAALAGALPGSHVTINVEKDEDTVLILVDVSNDDYTASRIINPGLGEVHNGSIVAFEHAPKGLGTRVLATQVKAAAAAGFTKLTAMAAGGGDKEIYDSEMNGYYTWPRLGYDGDVPIGRVSYAHEHGLKRVSDFMRTKEHRDWWRENGSAFDASFDLREGSLSRTVLDAYVESKGIKLAWDESEHPREEAGTSEGGQFTLKALRSGTKLDAKGKPDSKGPFVETLLAPAKGQLRKAAKNDALQPIVDAWGREETVDPTKVRTAQHTVDPDRVAEYVMDPDTKAHVAVGKTGNKLLIVRVAGEMAVVDGNHRLVAAAIKGKKIRAIVVDMDAAYAAGKPYEAEGYGYLGAMMKAAEAKLKGKL